MEEIVFSDLVEGRPSFRVQGENRIYQVFGLRTDLRGFREGVGILLDFLVGCLYIRCLERRLTNKKRVDNNPQ